MIATCFSGLMNVHQHRISKGAQFHENKFKSKSKMIDDAKQDAKIEANKLGQMKIMVKLKRLMFGI